MIKKLSTFAVAMLLTTSAFAADTVVEKTDQMEMTVYGHVQQGAIVDRVGQLELTLYGHETNGKLIDNVDRLYREIEVDGMTPTLKTKVDMLQWTYDGKITEASLIERMNILERAVLGRVTKDDLEKRVYNMESILLGPDKKLVFQAVAIPEDKVFKIILNEPINTKVNKVGDTFTFTVAEDIVENNLLVVPEGTVGQGVITKLQKARSFGRAAEIDLAFNNIATVSSTLFNADQGEEAKKRSQTEVEAAGASVAGVAILGPIGLVGGFFVKGHDIQYPEGQGIYVQPVQNVDTYGVGLEVNHTSSASSTKVNAVAKGAAQSSKEAVKEEVKEVSKKSVAAKTEESKENIHESAKNSSAPTQAVVVIKKSE